MQCRPVRKIYYNAGNGYTVASYITEEELPEKVVQKGNGGYGLFQAVGIELPTSDGLDLELEGEWKNGKYGMQYEVSCFKVYTPTTEEGIRAYLSSNLIKGIGPVTAEEIVNKFGKKTFYVLENCPEELLNVRGITESRLNEIIACYRKSNDLRELMVYMSPLGLTPRKIAMIQEYFGNAALHIVKENPFRLCEISGFGFLTVDPIAIRAKNFKPNNPFRIKAAIQHIMKEAEEEGHLFLTSQNILDGASRLLNHKRDTGLVSERAIKDAGNDMIRKEGSLIVDRGAFYTPKCFHAELGAAAALVKLMMQKGMEVKIDGILERIQKNEKIILSKKQKEAIRMAFSHPVSIITGGPGRGKTTIIRFIIAIQEVLNKEAAILLCAPTGKARRRMYESTGYPALTIHKAVGLTGEEGEDEWNDYHTMPDDLVIADEFSMVDMFLADKLFSSIKSGARLVMVGDKDQIESVGPGNVFKEMIDSNVIPVTILDENFRQESNSTIYQNGDKINKNRLDLVFDDTFQFYPAMNAKEASEIIQKLYQEELEMQKGTWDDVQVLSPLRKDTEVGADALNLVLHDIVNPHRKGYPEVKNGKQIFRENDKVMQIKNMDEVSNGDVGEVLNIYHQDGKNMMRVDFGDERIMTYEDDDFWPLIHAYAMSVHKSQGSEYPVVILPMLSCFRRMLRRNLFYTAVTRAQKKVIIVGSKRAMAQAIRTDAVTKRNTRFGEQIQRLLSESKRQQRKTA
ncbi:SF1B family DNA helicase RecD2 [Parablautia sp. Marseille-Q6255]|uniref:SF1B family DNA helicase RecD2 n=1 Tax=Parablautia sp. Marseille-Q6255 TaxID=3039593 RepID=UPI0024BD4E9F|nr:ATP-dependent RecD-like DNA helicase [Parablautia sp. Marseille-Q6255]